MSRQPKRVCFFRKGRRRMEPALCIRGHPREHPDMAHVGARSARMLVPGELICIPASKNLMAYIRCHV